jgi:hypothetical protein
MGQERLMRGDDHVRKRQQPRQHVVLQRQVAAVLEKQLRFFLIHIQSQIAQLAVLQCIDQRRRVHQAAAPGVDQHRPRLQMGQ